MSSLITKNRWQQAQKSEQKYWDVLDVPELLRICAEKPEFLRLLSESKLGELFVDKTVLEIGCGPLGVALASFFREKEKIRRLVKVDPLPRIYVRETSAAREEWASEFVAWVTRLSMDGEYLQKPGEEINFRGEFDTVVTYNVLDHVHSPREVIASAYRALSKGGKILVGVDCLSLVGRLKFEYLTRRSMRGSVLVEAHPHTFLPGYVIRMMQDEGFKKVHCFGAPNILRRAIGSHYRPAFVGEKP